MAFKATEAHCDEFRRLGFTVFRGILPAFLIADLRRATDQGRERVRKQNGAQSQRFQPVAQFAIDQKPFEDYRDLPALVDALAKVLSPRHRHGDLTRMGVLIEPAEKPWCTNWHRDWIHHRDPGVFEAVPTDFQDLNLFNQINCALYEDGSTWVVPSSHLRPDLPAERAAFSSIPVKAPDLEGRSDTERECECLAYCRRMPGALQLQLNAGDFALYRNVMWHLGNYAPYRKRATLHDSPQTPEYAAWQKSIEKAGRERLAKVDA